MIDKIGNLIKNIRVKSIKIDEAVQTVKIETGSRKPFKFLNSYTINDRDIFFGREMEIREIYYKVFSNRMTVIFGESGTGKTSVVQCGLMSEVQDKVAFFTVRSAVDPVKSIRNELLKNICIAKQNNDLTNQNIADFLKNAYFAVKKTIILFFDQFEEIYTVLPSQKKDEFIKELKNISQIDADIRIVINIREEFFGKLYEFEKEIPEILKNKVWIKKMSRNQALETIIKPCEVCSVEISGQTAESIMDGIAVHGKGVELPLLQVVMDHLYAKCYKEYEKFAIIFDSKKDSIKKIMGDFLSEQIRNSADADMTKEVLKALITEKGTKRVASIEELDRINLEKGEIRLSRESIITVLEELKERRIVLQDGDSGSYELLHDFIASRIYEELLSGEEKEALRVKEKIEFMQENGIELEEKFLSSVELMLKEGRLKLRADIENEKRLLEYTKQCSINIDARKKRKKRFVVTSVSAALLVLIGFSLFIWLAYNKAERNLKESYFMTAQTLLEKSKSAATKKYFNEARLYRIGSEYYQKQAHKYFSGFNMGNNLNIDHLKTLDNQSSGVYSISYSSDGKYIASGGSDGKINIWDVISGHLLKSLKDDGDDCDIFSINYSPDGKYIASSYFAGYIKIWNVSSGKMLKKIGDGDYKITITLSYSPDGKFLVSGDEDKKIKIWEIASGTNVKTLIGHNGAVESICYSPDGNYLASGSADKTIKIWDLSNFREIKTLKGHEESICTISYSPDGKYIVSGSADKTIKRWDVVTGKELKTLKGHSESVYSLNFSPDGKYIASGSGDKTIKIWEMSTNSEVYSFEGHTNVVRSIRFSHDGKYIASGSNDRTIKIWEMSTNGDVHNLSGYNPWSQIEYSPDGKFFASGSLDGTIKIWEALKGKNVKILKGHYGSVWTISYSPDGKHLASAGEDKYIKIWDLTSNSEIKSLRGHNGRINSISYSPDGKFIVSGSVDSTLKIWESSSGRLVNVLKDSYCEVNSLDYSPEGKYIASGSSDGTIKIWESSSGREIETFKGYSGYSINYSIDGKHIAGSSDHAHEYSNSIKIWKVTKSKIFKTVISWIFSSQQYKLDRWEWLREFITLDGHHAEVNYISYSIDGKYLASGSSDKTIKIWDLSNGKALYTLEGSSDKITSICYNPDGKSLVAGCADSTLRIFNLSEDRVISNISIAEYNDYLKEIEQKTQLHLNGISAVPFENITLKERILFWMNSY